jgi:hypothetical protein
VQHFANVISYVWVDGGTHGRTPRQRVFQARVGWLVLAENEHRYSGRKITASFGYVTVRGGKDGKDKGEARRRRVCLSMYSITENIYYSQLSSVAILL